ncbi:MAG: toxin-antitoxin system HicB family antitoxin [Candidatus Parabeggiatoa sp. nov. 2]|nr:MAG: antitoxin HicB [Beggiatoa sp. 4572_84]RKZ58325.1 MAG: toxin-antitoxin system HicB family antitoxin [Gammaproteobacteria bacterium]
MLNYKGYIGQVEFDDEADIFHGEVINTRAVITFQGTTVPEIKAAFIDSVEDYLAFCAELGEEPEKPYSGELSLKLPPQVHRDMTRIAKLENKPVDTWICEHLTKASQLILSQNAIRLSQ